MELFPTTKPVRPCTLPIGPTVAYLKNKINFNNMKLTEESPKNMELSMGSSNPNSPSWVEPQTSRAKLINKRWMDYQGFKNWEGLLDPLDDNLRSEIIRYGHFVEAAYRSCDFNPSSSSYATCRYSKKKLLSESGFPGTGYRVTKNLIATSLIELPGWAERGPTWMAMRSGWVGYVAVCQDAREISRLGRRDVVIAFRGTATGLEWLENLRATLTPLPNPDSDLCPESAGSDSNPDSQPMVESGFLSLYTSGLKNRPSLQKLLWQEISRILGKYGDEPLSFTITGHSLGAALATLAAYDIKKTFKNQLMVTVISFAGPRVGDRSFRCHLEKQGTKILRIVNSDDLITKVPGFVVDNNENENDGSLNNSGGYTAAAAAGLARWFHKLVEAMKWVYADVGCELRLSSRDSPYLNDINFVTCHDLKTYLHLVDGFVSSNCPFRTTARKIMNVTN
ncbi:Dolichyl-diphosphooligosaccharide-protein glycosyltransferase subunit dad1 [Orobanche hederae]